MFLNSDIRAVGINPDKFWTTYRTWSACCRP
jgi:hypothetical protein